LIIQTSGGTTNDAILEATGGGTLVLFGNTVTNKGAGTIMAGSGSTVLLEGVTVKGGSLTGSGTFVVNGAGGTPTLNGLTNASTVAVNNATTLLLAGTITNNGQIQENSGGNTTEIQLAGNVTLNGTGALIMSNNPNNYIFGQSGADILTNNITIEGAGHLGDGQMTMVNNGTINANQSNPLLVSMSGTFNNTGTIEATASGGLVLTASGGFLNYSSGTNTLTGGSYIANGGNVTLPLGASGGISTLAATIVEENGGQILNGNNSNNNALNGLTSITSSGALTIGGVAFTDAGAFSNAGSLTLLSGESFTVGSLTQISGNTLTAGTYVLDANLNLSGTPQTITTNAANLTLAGGTIENTSNSTNALAGLATNTGTLTIGGTSNHVSTTAASFSNSGTLIVNTGDSFTAGNLAQISGNTLTGGTYVLAGDLDLTTSGVSITTNSANLTLEGTGTIKSGAANALAALSSNTNALTLASAAKFTTAGNFTNSGALTLNSGTTLTVTGTLTNLSGGTLSGGTYTIGGTLQLASGNGGITTNAANLTLTGAAKILDGASNALATFNNNTGTFALASAAKLTTAASNFTNSGAVTLAKGTMLTVGGSNSYLQSQSSGTTTVDGTLVATNITATGGSVFGAGTIKGNTSIGNASGTAVTLNVGDAGKAGLLSITGTYTQLSTGTMNLSIGGKAAGTFSLLKITGAASLGGTLTAALVNNFTPTVGQMFTILTASGGLGGTTFSNTTIAINNSEHFAISYTGTSVVLTVMSGQAAPNGNPAVVQPVIASIKPAVALARPPVVIGKVLHPVGVPIRSNPIWERGLIRGGESPATSGRVWETENLRLPHGLPEVSLWKDNSERLHSASRITIDNAVRPIAPVENHWMSRNGLRVSPTSGMFGLSAQRPTMPAKMFPTHLPMAAMTAR
jgi:fibronectin-binding autotransporter adhesin